MHSSSGGDTDATKMQSRADDKHISNVALNKSTAMLSLPLMTSTLMTTVLTRTRGDRGLPYIGRLGTSTSINNNGTDDILAGLPVNLRAVVFGSSAAFLLLVLVIVVLSSRRRCRSALSHESPSAGGSFGLSTASATPPARLVSYVLSQSTMSAGGDAKPSDANATLEPPMPAAQHGFFRKQMLWPVDENGDFYATKYDSSNRPQKTSATVDSGIARRELGDTTNASSGGNRHHNLQSNRPNRSQLQDEAVASVAVVHRTHSGETVSAGPRRPHSLRSTATGSSDMYCQESSGTALDSGVSGMDVSTSVTQDDIATDGFKPSSLPVYISVMVASTTPSDASIVSSMSISEESNSDDEDLSRSSPRPSSFYGTDVEIPSNRGTPLEQSVANVSDDSRLSAVRHRHHHNNHVRHHNNHDIIDDIYGKIGESKRLKFIKQRPDRIPGSPHPRRAAIPWRFLPSRSVANRRRCTGDVDDSSTRKPWRQWRHHSSSETDMEASTSIEVEVESPIGRNTVQAERFGSSRSEAEDGESVSAMPMPDPTPLTEVDSDHAVDVVQTSHAEPCLKLPSSSSHNRSSNPHYPTAIAQPTLSSLSSAQQSTAESNQFPTSSSVIHDPADVDSDHDRNVYGHHIRVTHPETHTDHGLFDYGGSATFLSSTTINHIEVASHISRAESDDDERRRQLGQLLQREDFADVNDDVLEHIYDEYGGIERIATATSRGVESKTASTPARTVEWELKTVF